MAVAYDHMARSDSESGRTIQATEISCRIIDAIDRLGQASLTEIADRVDISKSAVYNHLSTLERNGFVVKKDGEYRLSLRFVDYGITAKNNYDIRSVAKNPAEELAEQTGEVVQFMIEEHGKGVYLIKAEGEDAVNTRSYVGSENHLHCTALGKAILAHSPEERVEEIIDRHGLPEQTPNTITDREALFEQLDAIRERGYALDREEILSGLRCVAAPVFDEEDTLYGSISVSGPKTRFDGDYFEKQLPQEVRRTANVIEVNMAGF